MALKIVEGAVAELGEATALASEAGPTGISWSFVRFDRGQRAAVTLERVMADPVMAKRIAPKQAGRFAFYLFDRQLVLCGFAGAGGIEIAKLESDPAAIAADAIRLPAKRKIFWGVVLIPTIIGLFFAFDMIRAGRAKLKANPAPKRPSDERVTARLKGQWWRLW
ncbi:MAG: hypothetical protein QM773_02245 [Hyphomonadaceae bacterium]